MISAGVAQPDIIIPTAPTSTIRRCNAKGSLPPVAYWTRSGKQGRREKQTRMDCRAGLSGVPQQQPAWRDGHGMGRRISYPAKAWGWFGPAKPTIRTGAMRMVGSSPRNDCQPLDAGQRDGAGRGWRISNPTPMALAGPTKWPRISGNDLGCVKTRVGRASAQQQTRQLRTRESLLPATAVTRINVARPGLENSFHKAWTQKKHWRSRNRSINCRSLFGKSQYNLSQNQGEIMRLPVIEG